MAWTTPALWTTGEVPTSAKMNAQIRDNFLETSAATATTAGDLVYADGANSMGSRLAIGGGGTSLVSTGSAPVWRETTGMRGDATYQTAGIGEATAYTDLDSPSWGSGTSVTRTVTTGTRAMVWYGARSAGIASAGAFVQIVYRVSGATTIAGGATWDSRAESSNSGDEVPHGRAHFESGLNAGSNTFTLQALGTNGSTVSTIRSPYLVVMAL